MRAKQSRQGRHEISCDNASTKPLLSWRCHTSLGGESQLERLPRLPRTSFAFGTPRPPNLRTTNIMAAALRAVFREVRRAAVRLDQRAASLSALGLHDGTNAPSAGEHTSRQLNLQAWLLPCLLYTSPSPRDS